MTDGLAQAVPDTPVPHHRGCGESGCFSPSSKVQPPEPALAINAHPGPGRCGSASGYSTQGALTQTTFPGPTPGPLPGAYSASAVGVQTVGPLRRPHRQHNQSKDSGTGPDRHAGTCSSRETDCTMLFVDGGSPIDVIFYASVWGRRKKRRRESRSASELRRLPAH